MAAPTVPQFVAGTVVAVGLGVLAAFWQLSDPRQEIKNIRSTYLTLREHEEFVTRFNSDIHRLETELIKQRDEDVTHREWDALVKRIEGDRNRDQAVADKLATRDELLAHIEKDTETLQGLRREIDALRREIERTPTPPLPVAPNSK